MRETLVALPRDPYHDRHDDRDDGTDDVLDDDGASEYYERRTNVVSSRSLRY